MTSSTTSQPETSSAAATAAPAPTIILPLSRPPSYEGQQAGPLPTKPGELGFIEGVHGQTSAQANRSNVPLPARHPADRDAPSDANEGAPPTLSNNGVDSQPPPSSTSTSSPTPTQDPVETENKPALFKNKTFFGGVRIATFGIFLIQLVVMGACIAIWVLLARRVAAMTATSRGPGGMSTNVFVHVVFAFAIIGQLIFLERRLFTIRAERYAYLHPGEMLPRYRNRTHEGGDLNFAYAPWNRPPLPTYAAVLAQSGHGTGDVEDHIIAVSPPPAYGNTRGSRMLLQGFLTDELRAQRPASAHSICPDVDLERGEGDASPVLRERVERRREETLAQLENADGRNSN